MRVTTRTALAPVFAVVLLAGGVAARVQSVWRAVAAGAAARWRALVATARLVRGRSCRCSFCTEVRAMGLR